MIIKAHSTNLLKINKTEKQTPTPHFVSYILTIIASSGSLISLLNFLLTFLLLLFLLLLLLQLLLSIFFGLAIRHLLFFLVQEGLRPSLNPRLTLKLLLLLVLFMFDSLFRSNGVFEADNEVKSKIAIRHKSKIQGIIALFLLSVRHLECFGQLIKLEILHMDECIRFPLTQENIPSLSFEERIGRRATKVAQPISSDRNDDLKDIFNCDVSFLINFEIALSINFREIFNAFLDVAGSIGIQQIQEEIPFFLLLDQSLKTCYLSVLLLLVHPFYLLLRQIELRERL